MKKYFFFALTAAMMSFAGCQEKELEAPVNPNQGGSTFELVADIAQTKTTLDATDYSVEWETGDIVYLVTLDGTWGAPYVDKDNTNLETIAEFVYADGRFTSDAAITAGEYTFKAMYAHESQKSYHRGESSTHKLQSTQTQDCANPTAHIKGNDALVGMFTAYVPATDKQAVTMSHLYTLMQVNVRNSTGASVDVTKFEMTAAGADLAGVFNVDFENTAITTKSSASSTITVNVTGGNVDAGQALPVYFVMAPLSDYTGDVTFKVTAADGKTYTKTIAVSNLDFNAGAYNTTPYTISEADVVEPEQTNVTWNLAINETSEATENKIAWTSDFAEMYCEKGSASTNANNYYGGDTNNRNSTRFYAKSVLTIEPKSGYAITSVVFEATSENYATALGGSTWTNASASASKTTVTVTPTDGTKAMVATLAGTCGCTSVVVYYEVSEGGETPETPETPEVATWSWAGGVSADFKNFNGVISTTGFGSDYAESNAPYRIKLDTSNDNFVVKVNGAIQSVSVGVKMLGGSDTSYLDFQGSSDGSSYSSVQKHTISGKQNDILELTTSNTFDASYRYIKFNFTKGSNVGVGPITITYIPDNNEGGGEAPEPEQPAAPKIEVTSVEQSIGAEGGDLEFEYTVTNTDNELVATVTKGTDFLESVEVENDIIAVTVKENETASERVAEITLTCGDATPVVLTITQAGKVVVDDSFEPGLYWIMATKDGTTKVMTPLGETANYGYGQSTTVTDGRSYARNAFTFTAVEGGGFTIQDVLGRYYYTTDEHKSFQLSSDPSADGLVWTVGVGDNGTVILTNVGTSRTLKYGDGTYTTFGVYKDSEEETGVYPTLVKADNPLPVELSSISVNGHKTSFAEGDAFEFGGTVTANYSDGTTKNVTANASVTTPEMVNGASVTVSYTDGGITKTFSYKITVKAADVEEVTIVLSAATRPCDNFPNTSTGVTTPTTYTIGDYEWTFAPSSGNKFSWYNDKKYILWGKSGGYILMPAVPGKKLISVTILTGTGASTSVKVGVYNAGGTAAVSGGEAITLSQQNAEFTWTLTGTEVNTHYQLRVTSNHNAQLQTLTLIYE